MIYHILSNIIQNVVESLVLAFKSFFGMRHHRIYCYILQLLLTFLFFQAELAQTFAVERKAGNCLDLVNGDDL